MTGAGGRGRGGRQDAAATATGELVAVPVSEPEPVEERHLGGRLAAFVDGELGHDARERVLVHLADCDACRAAADEQRRVKNVLSGIGTPEPGAGLLARLRALPDIPEEPPGRDAPAADGPTPPDRGEAPRRSGASRPAGTPRRPGGSGAPHDGERADRLAAAGQAAARMFRTPAAPAAAGAVRARAAASGASGTGPGPRGGPAGGRGAASGTAAAAGAARHRRLVLVAAFSAAAVALSGAMVATSGGGERGGDDPGGTSPHAHGGVLAGARHRQSPFSPAADATGPASGAAPRMAPMGRIGQVLHDRVLPSPAGSAAGPAPAASGPSPAASAEGTPTASASPGALAPRGPAPLPGPLRSSAPLLTAGALGAARSGWTGLGWPTAQRSRIPTADVRSRSAGPASSFGARPALGDRRSEPLR